METQIKKTWKRLLDSMPHDVTLQFRAVHQISSTELTSKSFLLCNRGAQDFSRFFCCCCIWGRGQNKTNQQRNYPIPKIPQNLFMFTTQYLPTVSYHKKVDKTQKKSKKLPLELKKNPRSSHIFCLND